MTRLQKYYEKKDELRKLGPGGVFDKKMAQRKKLKAEAAKKLNEMKKFNQFHQVQP